MPELVTSFVNPTVKRYRALSSRKHRRREGAFVVEGLQPVWRAVTSSWTIDTVIVAPDLLRNDAARAMAYGDGMGAARVVEVSADVFRHLSERDGPAGLAAIVRGEIGDVAAFDPVGGQPVAALHRVGNPGNLGTVVRSIDAAGGAGVVLVGDCADPLAPSAVKASMGSLFAVPVVQAADVDALFTWAAGRDRRIVAVTGHADTDMWACDLPSDAVLLFGSEGDGLPDPVASRCDVSVRIPMTGTAESLNLATAASVAFFEMARRRSGPANADDANQAGDADATSPAKESQP